MGLVVEHLLEVRDEPVVVGRVAVEAAAEVVANAAAPHLVEGGENHFERFKVAGARVIPEQEFQGRRAGELGRAAEAAVPRVEGAAEGVEAGIEDGRVEDAGCRGLGVHTKLIENGATRFDDGGAVHLPRLSQALEDAPEAGVSVARLGREVGAAEERPQIGRKPDGHGPAAGAGGGLHEEHVDAVDVGALFAVHLDGDEVAVEEGGDVLVLEGLALHDVAPVAGGVADGEEDGLVLVARLLESFFAPGAPVDWIVGVLEQVRTLLVDQGIRWHPRPPLLLCSSLVARRETRALAAGGWGGGGEQVSFGAQSDQNLGKSG